MKRKLIVGFLALCSITTICPSVYASTEHYTDSSVTGADSGWSDWDANWADTAADFTKVSLTPGADDTATLLLSYISELIKITLKHLKVLPVM